MHGMHTNDDRGHVKGLWEIHAVIALRIDHLEKHQLSWMCRRNCFG